MFVRCFCTSTGEFINVDVTDLLPPAIETDALVALRRIREGDRDFIFSYNDVEYPLDDVRTIECIAAWQQPDPIMFLAA